MTESLQQDRARGMIDAPLSDIGRAQADHLGRRIAAKGGIDTLVSSPMQRARETAAAILKHNPGARMIEVSPGLEPLHQGYLEGKTRGEVEPAMEHFARHPQERIPGIGLSGVPGESLDSHSRRVGREIHKHLHELKSGERRLLLAHHSTIRALRGWIKAGGRPDFKSDPHEMATPRDVAEPAGEILRLAKHAGRPAIESNDLESDDPIKPGLNFSRHGATELNGGDSSVVRRLALHRRASAPLS